MKSIAILPDAGVVSASKRVHYALGEDDIGSFFVGNHLVYDRAKQDPFFLPGIVFPGQRTYCVFL